MAAVSASDRCKSGTYEGEAMKITKKVAVVHCAGGCLTEDGQNACRFGCIGCGKCVEACRLHAVEIDIEKGVAHVDRAKCVGCGKCAAACPQGVIRIELREDKIQPLCSNGDAGAAAKKVCPNSCISCGMCVKKCPSGAISLENNVPVINENRCIACGMCAAVCPRGVIRDADGIITERY
jgi:ferredoxin